MKITCFGYSNKYPNKCSVLSGDIDCNKCKFYLTDTEYKNKIECLKEVRKRLRRGG